MSKQNYETMSATILELVGGKSNISQFSHCMTRLRFTVKDKAGVKVDEIAKVSGVLGTQWLGEQLQVIIGQDVEKVYDKICDLGNFKKEKAVDEILDAELASEGKITLKKFGAKIMPYITNAFIPLIPALVGSGMLKGILSIAVYFGWLDTSGATYAVLSAAGNAVFYFIPLLIAYNTAKYLNTNVVVAIVVMAALMEPNFTALQSVEGATTLFGIKLSVISYDSLIIPALVIVPVLAQLEKLLKRIIPKVVQILFVPLISIFVMVVLSVLVIGPLTNALTNGIAAASSWLNDTNAILFGIIVGGTVGYLTILGVHMALLPVILLNFTNMGADPVLAFMSATCYAQIGVAFSIWFRSKDTGIKSLAGASAITALFAGVTEPILFGVCMENKKTYPVIGIAGAVGGMIMGIFGCKAYGFVNAGVLGLTGYFSDTFGYYLLAAAASMLVGFVLMNIYGFRNGKGKVNEASGR